MTSVGPAECSQECKVPFRCLTPRSSMMGNTVDSPQVASAGHLQTLYRKHFIPLESDPDVFTELINLLGVPPSLCFEDVLSLDGPHFFPRPVLALILVLPTTESYESQKAVEDKIYEEVSGEDNEDIIWYKQTINNACGFCAILHALSNGVARNMIGKFQCFLFQSVLLELTETRGRLSHRRSHRGLCVHAARRTVLCPGGLGGTRGGIRKGCLAGDLESSR